MLLPASLTHRGTGDALATIMDALRAARWGGAFVIVITGAGGCSAPERPVPAAAPIVRAELPPAPAVDPATDALTAASAVVEPVVLDDVGRRLAFQSEVNGRIEVLDARLHQLSATAPDRASDLREAREEIDRYRSELAIVPNESFEEARVRINDKLGALEASLIDGP